MRSERAAGFARIGRARGVVPRWTLAAPQFGVALFRVLCLKNGDGPVSGKATRKKKARVQEINKGNNAWQKEQLANIQTSVEYRKENKRRPAAEEDQGRPLAQTGAIVS